MRPVGRSSDSPLGSLAWAALLAFVRLATKVEIFPSPLGAVEAMGRVEAWTGAAPAVIAHPTHRQLEVLGGLLAQVGTGGNLVSDAHLAALALEHNATVVTYDRDFGRFPGVAVAQPSPVAPIADRAPAAAGRTGTTPGGGLPTPPRLPASGRRSSSTPWSTAPHGAHPISQLP